MPIIVGSPRSGTTLLRFMLDSHPELTIPPETGFLALAPKLRGRGDKLREKFFHAVINYPQPFSAWPDFEIPEDAFWAALTEIVPFTVPEGFRAFYRLYAARFGKSRWGDKTPLYCMELDTIRRVLPEARFIHIIRDGRDTALSLRRMWFSPGWEIETQAAYWRKNILSARRGGPRTPGLHGGTLRGLDPQHACGSRTNLRVRRPELRRLHADLLHARPGATQRTQRPFATGRHSTANPRAEAPPTEAYNRTAGPGLRLRLEAVDEHGREGAVSACRWRSLKGFRLRSMNS